MRLLCTPSSITLPIALLFAGIAVPAWGQNTVIQNENVRTEYARVLSAEPVYQTLRATSMVERCEQSTPVAPSDREQKHGLARVLGAVKDAFTPDSDAEQAAKDQPTGTPRPGCRMVPVDREFRRPIAYDVDYVHHGVRYRSRLPYDPGNRLRVRVSITPIVPPAGDR